MALIPCPECEQQASDRARACPHCGFPVAEEIERALADVSGTSARRSARQIHAAGKLLSWSEGYGRRPLQPGQEGSGSFFERHRRLILGIVVVLFVSLQLFFLYSAAYQ